MAFIDWEPSLSVQIASIDEQHKILIHLINRLHDAKAVGHGSDALEDILDQLSTYAVSHFGHEEQLMRQFNYPDFIAHKKTHNEFIAKLGDFKAEFIADHNALAGEVFDFLKNWLIRHIKGTDMQYSPHLRDKVKNL